MLMVKHKFKLTQEEVGLFSGLFVQMKLVTNKLQAKQLRERKNVLMKQLGNKYGFDWKQARLFSDGVIEVD